jgi:hypothetical protein
MPARDVKNLAPALIFLEARGQTAQNTASNGVDALRLTAFTALIELLLLAASGLPLFELSFAPRLAQRFSGRHRRRY